MAFNLKKHNKIALTPIPPLGDVAYNPENPLYIAWLEAVSKVLPAYKAQNPAINDINSAMAALGKTPEDVMTDAQAIQPNVVQEQEKAIGVADVARTSLETSHVPFNFKIAKIKIAQSIGMQPPMDPMGLNDSPELMGDQFEEQQGSMNEDFSYRKFNGKIDFFNWLVQETSQEEAAQYIIANGDDNGQMDAIREGVERFYTSTELDAMEIGKTLEVYREDQAFAIYELLPDNLTDKGEVMGIPKKFSEVDEIMKKIIQSTANKNKIKVFNLKKTAQHKTLDNAIMWGPGQMRIDPFLHQPVSDWHIVERNKGFGLVVDDIWNIDYETIWRENIMDKYSRPYKNKEGEWVGGYFNKRFETDRNIPPENNIQLKPGQLRKPILPEYGNIESRLQAARAAGDIEGAIDKSKPFNWKEASKKKS